MIEPDSTNEEEVPSALVRAVYFAHLEHFDEPDHSIRFGDGTVREGKEHFPPVIDVMLWRANDSCDITTFATIGMSERPLTGAKHRAEIHFSIRATLSETDEHKVALFLANLATYPFHYGTHLDWWHSVRDPGTIPLFSEGMSVLFHPRFVDDGWDTIVHEGQTVKLLNAIPITQEERQLKNDSGLNALFEVWEKLNLDLFAIR